MTHPTPGVQEIVESSVVRRGPRLTTVPVADGAVLVDGGAGRAHALNATGALVWELLDGTGAVGDLIDDLAAEFDAPRATVAADVLGLVGGLARLGLLDGYGTDAGGWPVEPAPFDDGCPPAADPTTRATFDGRYLAVPPNA